MIVISDTSCIGYLIIIDKLLLLKENFSEIIVPKPVHKEILQLSSKYNVDKYLQADWIKSMPIKNIQLHKQLLNRVDEGEFIIN
jgi:predicted nucleic acid-binding protein